MTQTDYCCDLISQISTGKQVKKTLVLWKKQIIPFFSLNKTQTLNIIRTNDMETYQKKLQKIFLQEPILCLLQMQDAQPSGSEKYYAFL